MTGTLRDVAVAKLRNTPAMQVAAGHDVAEHDVAGQGTAGKDETEHRHEYKRAVHGAAVHGKVCAKQKLCRRLRLKIKVCTWPSQRIW